MDSNAPSVDDVHATQTTSPLHELIPHTKNGSPHGTCSPSTLLSDYECSPTLSHYRYRTHHFKVQMPLLLSFTHRYYSHVTYDCIESSVMNTNYIVCYDPFIHPLPQRPTESSYYIAYYPLKESSSVSVNRRTVSFSIDLGCPGTHRTC